MRDNPRQKELLKKLARARVLMQRENRPVRAPLPPRLPVDGRPPSGDDNGWTDDWPFGGIN
jgi:hypothetical protein